MINTSNFKNRRGYNDMKTQFKKNARYWKAVEFISLNDDPGSSGALDIDSVEDQVTVVLVSEVFEIKQKEVASDVIKVRKEQV